MDYYHIFIEFNSKSGKKTKEALTDIGLPVVKRISSAYNSNVPFNFNGYDVKQKTFW